MNNGAKSAIGTAGLGGLTVGADIGRGAELGTTALEGAGIVQGAVDTVNRILDGGISLVENIPYAGAAAPFLFPMIAGGKGAHLLASKFGPKSKLFRGLATITGAGIGAALTTTAAAQYLAVLGLGYTAWKSPRVLEWVARKGVAFPVQGVKWIGDGAKRVTNATGAKNWGSGHDGVFA